MMFQEGISFWKVILVVFSILNRVQTKHRPNLGWFLGGHEEGGGCLAEVATPASRTLHRRLRTTSAVVGGYGRGVATARRGKRWNHWIAWVFCSQKTWDSLRKVWRTFALPCGILSWISQGKMLEFENGHTKYTKILSVWRSLLEFFTGTRHVEPHNTPTKMPLLKTKTFIPYTSAKKRLKICTFPSNTLADIVDLCSLLRRQGGKTSHQDCNKSLAIWDAKIDPGYNQRRSSFLYPNQSSKTSIKRCLPLRAAEYHLLITPLP